LLEVGDTFENFERIKKKKIVKFAQKSMAHKTSQAIVSALMFVSA
jgi:hypothetical protein